MAAPCSLCLEDLLTEDPDQRYLRCVALPGRQPGLRIHTDGSVGWMTSEVAACELVVSLDQKLILLRPIGAPPVRVERAGRGLLAPPGKPVVLLDGDEVKVAGRHLRVHIHGEAAVIAPPTPLLGRALRAAAVVALGAAVLSCERSGDVREQASAEAIPLVSTPSASVSASSNVEPEAPASASASASSVSDVPDASAPPGASSNDGAKPPPSTSARPRPPKTPRKPPRIEVRDMPPFAE